MYDMFSFFGEKVTNTQQARIVHFIDKGSIKEFLKQCTREDAMLSSVTCKTCLKEKEFKDMEDVWFFWDWQHNDFTYVDKKVIDALYKLEKNYEG